MIWVMKGKILIRATRTGGTGLTDGFSYDTNDTEDICDYDGHEPIYKYGTKVCNQFKMDFMMMNHTYENIVWADPEVKNKE